MKKTELTVKTEKLIATTKEALQTVYDALNKGQRQKLLKNENIVTLFVLYGVDTEQGV